MRDHPAHGFPILGGMWGAKKGAVPLMSKLIDEFPQQNLYRQTISSLHQLEIKLEVMF